MKIIFKTVFSLFIAVGISANLHAEDKIINGIPYVTLNNGHLMPRFGIGTFNDPGDSIACDAVSFALKNGYRHIDTAHAYRVERGVGKAVNELLRASAQKPVRHIQVFLHLFKPAAISSPSCCRNASTLSNCLSGLWKAVRYTSADSPYTSCSKS